MPSSGQGRQAEQREHDGVDDEETGQGRLRWLLPSARSVSKNDSGVLKGFPALLIRDEDASGENPG
jgi:hypothetical protein